MIIYSFFSPLSVVNVKCFVSIKMMKLFLFFLTISITSSCTLIAPSESERQLRYERVKQVDYKPRKSPEQIVTYESATETDRHLITLGYFTWCYTSQSDHVLQRGRFENALVQLKKEAAKRGGDALIIRERRYRGRCLNITADLIRYQKR